MHGYRTAVKGRLRVMADPIENRPASTPDAVGPPPAPSEPLSSEPSSSKPLSSELSSPDLAPPAASELSSPDLWPPAGADLRPADDARTARRDTVRVPRTRTSAVWFGVWAGAAALILLIIFVAQNTASVAISFLWLDGRIPIALALLIAGLCGALVAMAIAAARILQLRRLVRHPR
jgi:uncharacterized integral membrane protein